jgi:hypothetical protein
MRSKRIKTKTLPDPSTNWQRHPEKRKKIYFEKFLTDQLTSIKNTTAIQLIFITKVSFCTKNTFLSKTWLVYKLTKYIIIFHFSTSTGKLASSVAEPELHQNVPVYIFAFCTD